MLPLGDYKVKAALQSEVTDVLAITKTHSGQSLCEWLLAPFSLLYLTLAKTNYMYSPVGKEVWEM